ncbi:MAG: HNH endonuclease [Alphaproteobacteria bacterium]
MVKLFVAVTDNDWFDFLRHQRELTEVNFWQPRGSSVFRALQPGELFLFKLHSPLNFVVGGGVFSHATNLPLPVAWEAFNILNGARSLHAMRARIAYYRRETPDPRADYQIGCRILTQPLFLDEAQWIPIPTSWSREIVVGKTFSADDEDGRRLWEAIESSLPARELPPGLAEAPAKFGEPTLIRPRLGQGAFRVAVTDAYSRRCSVTRERVLPVLEAAHIRPYAEGGHHEVSNGILLRRDVHRIFDLGYATITPECRFEVSRRIKDDFDNGQEYFAMHGRRIKVPPDPLKQPNIDVIEWHNNNRYLTSY